MLQQIGTSFFREAVHFQIVNYRCLAGYPVRCMKLLNVLALMLAAPALLPACFCEHPNRACEIFTKVPSIFHGTVVSLSVEGMTLKADFVVSETFRGEARQQVSISTHSQSSACGFEFQKGLEYIVYASPDAQTGALSASSCSLTHRVDPGKQDDDLAWLRKYPNAPPTASLYGRQFLQSDFGFQKMTVKIRGPQDRDIATGADGSYAVDGLPPGDYTVSATVPDGLVTDRPHTLHLEAKGCAEMLWFIASDTHVTGRLFRPDGTPFAGMQVELLRPEPGYEGGGYPSGSMETAADGRFDFSGVPPGEYFVMANSLGPAPMRPWSQMYYKNSEKLETASKIHLEPGHNVENVEITMASQLKPLNVHARILLPDGTPARNVQVMAYDTEHRFVGDPPSAMSDDAGDVSLPLFAGREYFLESVVYPGCVPPFRFAAKEGLDLGALKVQADLRDCRPPRH
jgi:hypothetical protein